MSRQYMIKVRTNSSKDWGAVIFEDNLKGVNECISEFLENMLEEASYIEFRVEKPFQAEPEKRRRRPPAK